MPEVSTIADDRAEVGETSTPLVCGPIDRTTLALFAGGSGDHNRVHIDSDYARGVGMPDVIAHGMLSMAYMARCLARDWPTARVRCWRVRFQAITPVNTAVYCRTWIVERGMDGDVPIATLELEARTEGGVRTLAGQAVIELTQNEPVRKPGEVGCPT